MDAREAAALVSSVPHWHHSFEIASGLVTPGAYDPRESFERLDLPASLSGLRAIDLGTADGFYAMQLARRGADVTCVDFRAKERTGFAAMEQITGLHFDYRQSNVYDLDAGALGQFDIVLFLGVLYHLPDMLGGLRTVRALCRDKMFLETQAEEYGSDLPLTRYTPGSSLNNDSSNFWVPNRRCVREMLKDVGFDLLREEQSPTRLFVESRAVAIPHKTWGAW